MDDAARLTPLTALGARAPRVDRIGAVEIAENPDLALASLAARRGASVEGRLPVTLPGPGGYARGDGIGALWLGPDAWMIDAPLGAAPVGELAAQVKAAVGEAGSVTDQTDAWVAFEIACPDPGALFERLSMLDIRAMQPGQGSRGLIEHVGCLIVCRAPGRFAVIGPRASAGSLHHALASAATALATLAGDQA